MTIPVSVEEIGDEAFRGCTKLKYVAFEREGKSENTNSHNTKVGKVVLPRTLKMIGRNVFSDCEHIKEICTEEGCEISFSLVGIPDSVKVGLPLETMVGGVKFQDLRERRQLVIPEGIEKIGDYWFWGTNIENVEIPASVKEIGTGTFYDSKKLKSVTFAPGSKLERIMTDCFYRTGIEIIIVPKGVKEIWESAF